jgi:hypothetical protein
MHLCKCKVVGKHYNIIPPCVFYAPQIELFHDRSASAHQRYAVPAKTEFIQPLFGMVTQKCQIDQLYREAMNFLTLCICEIRCNCRCT